MLDKLSGSMEHLKKFTDRNGSGPVVQKLTTLLVKETLNFCTQKRCNFFAGKNVRGFCSAKAPLIFSAKKKIVHFILCIHVFEDLTNH